MFSCCWTPVIRSSRSTILFKFGSKAPLKEPSNLSLSLRKGLRRFRSCKRGRDWTHLNWRQGISRHWFEHTACSNNHTRNYWEACLLWGDSEREKEGFVSPQFSVWFESFQRIGHRYLDGRTLEMMIQRSRLQFKGSASSWNCHIFFFRKFFVSINIYFFFGKIVWNHPPHFNVAFIGKSASTYVVSANVAGFVTNNDVTLGDYSNTCYLFRKYLQTLNSSVQSHKLQTQT
jgi:hypothetical protein